MVNAPKDKSSDSSRVINLADFKAKKNDDEGFTAPTSPAHPALRALKKKGAK
jgi:hypothetical protein